jgi:alpha-tubulin suppressor-like RCC1 family protein
MGTSLPAVNLGTGAKATAIATGLAHACALLSTGDVKCWGSNSSGELGIEAAKASTGTAPSDMGDGLKAAILGIGRTAIQITTGDNLTCALLDNHQIKCWGDNTSGQLGQGDTRNRGAAPLSMGDALPPISLGTGRTALAIKAGAAYVCALLDDQSLKCWGDNAFGQLGSGDVSPRGSAPGQMGDALPTVDLGTGVTATWLGAGYQNTCVALNTGNVKCWGLNNSGELGLGDTFSRGDRAGTMGDALPVSQLEPGLPVSAVSCNTSSCCALFPISGTMKCWGTGRFGNLGSGNTDNLGDKPETLGANLPFVDVGAFARIVQMATGDGFTCAVLEDGRAKCWGANTGGELGQGDTLSRGDRAGTMGDQLPAIDL